jgi:hypothetical protein
MSNQTNIWGDSAPRVQDAHRLPGQQGRIPDAYWAMKELP